MTLMASDAEFSFQHGTVSQEAKHARRERTRRMLLLLNRVHIELKK